MHEHVSKNVNCFVPPPPRNRSINRRRPGDRYDKVNYPHGIDEEKSHEFYPRKFSLAEHGEVGGNCVANDNTHPKLIPLDGCSASEAVTFLTERWAAAVHLLDNSSADVSVKPSAYLGADDELSGRIGMQRYTKPTAM
ncbi:hypothetical protein MUK42_05743 [Musa troglodytarum]|uniref:Uncharacterized protein n=1 Tax=Musa troglodytarum TaxID=320322 RepID=A0A9E7HCZ1_9LILI|nr:hypothetical protein MUK42_05743 [Musa troglodytarum]